MRWPTLAEGVQILVALTAAAVAIATLRLAKRTHEMTDETRKVAVATEREAHAVAAQSEHVAAQAAATKDEAVISAEALRATIRPWLTRPTTGAPRVHSPRTGSSDLTVMLWLRNVGRGIALMPPDGATLRGRGREGYIARPGHVDQPALPPDEVARITFVVAGPDIDPDRFLSHDRNNGELWVTVRYSDVKGDQSFMAGIHLAAHNKDQPEWRIVEIEHFDADETEPFTTVRFDSAVDC